MTYVLGLRREELGRTLSNRRIPVPLAPPALLTVTVTDT